MIRRDFLKGALGAGVVGGVGAAAAAQPASPAAILKRRRPNYFFYHDGRHPLIYMYEPPMQKEEYEQGVDELIGTPVEAISFAMGDGRTVLHDTKVGELWGHNVKKWSHIIFRRAHQNAKHLIDTGHDPLRLICDRAHAKGKLLYPALLLQQGTRDREVDVRASNFNLENKHLYIAAAGKLPEGYRHATCLDFKHEVVRNERFAIIEETLSRYPVDGFELQMNYSPVYFHPNEVEAGSAVLTDWVARVYRAVKASGPERELIIRIPSSLEGCYSIGMDIKEWIRRGIVDALIPQNFSGPELIDPNADYRPVVDAAKGSGCRVLAALHSHLDSDRLDEANIALVRGAASNYWQQGIDGLYLAHWFGNWPYDAAFYEKLREISDPEVMAAKDKSYFISTVTGRYPNPTTEPGLEMQLPADLHVGQPKEFEIAVSDDLPRWGDVDRIHEVLLRVRIGSTTELDRLTFRLNGKPLPDSLLRKINSVYRMSAPRFRVFGYWHIFSLDREHWPVHGKNTVEITLTSRDPDVTPQIFVRDIELDVQYLMGKNFHRGQDPDLGPTVLDMN